MKIFELKKKIEKYAQDKNRVAAYFVGRSFTYYELDNNINLLLLKFSEMGVKPSTPIIIYMNNCVELLVAYLAVLLYGCIIVPIDRETPIKRVNDIIEICDAQLLLHNDTLKTKDILCNSYQIEGTTIEKKKYKPLGQCVQNMENDMIYIFTSGSTGKPKGVRLTYKGVENHANSKISLLKLSEDDRFCLSFSMGFVASVWQILVPIYLGAPLFIYHKNVLKNTLCLFDCIDNDKVSLISLIPNQLHAYCIVLEKRNKLPLEYLRRVILTGEKLEANVVRLFKQMYPNIQLINAYGQSECCDDTFHYLIPEIFDGDDVPIGSPIQNIAYVVLDGDGFRCHTGISGELLITGDCLANGYIDAEDENLSKFIFYNGVKYFKTGDLVRVIDGNLFFLGRIDNQLKVRGVRIEPEEIEHVIENYPGIEWCLVLSSKINTRAEAVLVCGYVAGQEVNINSLRQYMKSYLSEYKIPTLFYRLEKIPRLINGKIDRIAVTSRILKNIIDNEQYLLESEKKNKTKEVVKNEIVSFMGLASDVRDMSLVDIGVDSMSYIELVVYLEKEYDFEFDDDFLVYSRFSSIDELVDYVCGKIK